MRSSATLSRIADPAVLVKGGLWLALWLVAPVASAGDCAAALAPLMREPEPDSTRVAEARVVCAHEAQEGDADAGYRLAFFYLGLDAWNPDLAVALMRRAAIGGIPEAQYWLAWQYETGPLLPHEAGTALYWYESSARAEHPLALRRLADAYESGEFGLAPDPERALKLRADAARCER